MKHSIVYFVVPCYNEDGILQMTAGVLKEKLAKLIEQKVISLQSKVLFVDDGSKYTTWRIIEQLSTESILFTAIKLSRNKGHQNALLAGLIEASKCAAVTISIDADLQDDI